VAELAGRFWVAAGEPPPLPRDLTQPAMAGWPLVVVELPNLTLDGVRRWLARLRVAVPIGEPNRRLRGCLVTRAGHGFIFADALDPPDERRFSVAHEIAHFLRDYDALRRKAVARLGPGILDVLDGIRSATPEERIHAVLRETPVAAHVHLLSRDPDGRPLTPLEADAEAAADRLALELLAPADLVPSLGLAHFGLPTPVVERYAALLNPPAPIDPFVARLKKSW
jgi:hypothetical protein